MAKDKQQVNIMFHDQELVDQLDKMVKEDEADRSKLIRRLVREEWQRRHNDSKSVQSQSETK